MSVRGRVGATVLMVGAALTLTAAPALPSGLELAWNACFGQPGAAGVMSWTCDANTGSQTMVASFRPPAGVTKLEGIEVFVDFDVFGSPWPCPSTDVGAGPPLPCWWNFSQGQLRQSQLTPLHISPTDANGDPVVPCDNHYFLGMGAAGGGGMIVTGVSRGQFKGIAAIAAGTGLPVTANAQQYGFGFRISNGSTLPAGTCGGCTSSVCFVLNTISLHSMGVEAVYLQSPHPGSNNWVSWWPDTTPIPNRTWGSIKSIYR